ncbi:GNAT family N-acetyltransferase [Bacillus luteolus]|uniref:GNAT family N-acetyltransferase n=1 Tax=Litchfieldia luteola TaxID=682179 RepID=A0ABR9QPJ0_9BACI|nr:GNAT family N-acetyltransferase [Cytobacillus luteolus]MBE4910374.1 GNAT family N-acetyltransferase [Cytobacillus luteolus]MBP1942051.1 RimJ/RimL family protein N-acetyltransferase [Cytobacillus luteolus]
MNPILLDFPTEITTDRLIIRMPLPGDGKAVNEAIRASMNELQPWMPFAQKEPKLEETEANIREAHANFLLRKDLRLLIFHKETCQFIGSTGLHRINWDLPKFEIGYWIDSRHAKQGYITETVVGVTNFAFEELNAKRVEIRCDSLNINSRNVAERAGYTLEGILRNDDLAVDGTLRDTCVFSKIK